MRAGLVESPEEYYWSSYRDYIGFRKRWVWLETEWILKQFETQAEKGIRDIANSYKKV